MATHDLPGKLDQQDPILSDGRDEQLVSSPSLGIEGDYPPTRKDTTNVPNNADGVFRGTPSKGTSTHPVLLRCRQDIEISRDHCHMVDQTDGPRVRLCRDAMGAIISGGSRTHSFTRTKSPVNYKELAYGASGKSNKQRQLDPINKTLKPNILKVCVGPLQEERGKNVGTKNEDKQRDYVQLSSGENGGSKPLSSAGNNGKDSELHRPPLNPVCQCYYIWNGRGIARQEFRCNIRQMIRDHDPMFVIIESKVVNNNIEDVV